MSLCEWAALCRVLHTQVCVLAQHLLSIYLRTNTESLTDRGGAHHWPKLGHPTQNCRFCPFFSWQEIHLLRRGTAVYLYDHIKRDTFQTRTSASPQRQAQVKWASVEQQWTAVWWDAVRLYISKTNFPVLSAVTVLTAHTLQRYANIRRTLYIFIINNARKKLWAYKVLSSVKSWNYQKGN